METFILGFGWGFFIGALFLTLFLFSKDFLITLNQSFKKLKNSMLNKTKKNIIKD